VPSFILIHPTVWPQPHCARWDPAAPKKGHGPQFSTHVYRRQTAGWIHMPLGMEVGLGPGRIVLAGDPALPPKRGTPPCQFLAHEWIKMPLGTKVGLVPGHLVLHGNPAPPKRGHSPRFRPTSVVAKRSPISRILLSTCANGRPKTVCPMLSDRCPVLSSCPVYL